MTGMTKTGSPEIIDLTESSPPSEVIVFDSDDNDIEIAAPDNAGRESGTRRARRKRKKVKTTFTEDGEVVESSVPASRDRSGSREREHDQKDPSLQRRRSRSPQPHHKPCSPQPRDNFADLFFVDVEPALVPDAAKLSVLRATSPKSAQLLLPDHVSILEFGEGGKEAGPIEIIRPPTPNPAEDDDFIEYLDYDNQHKVR